MLLSVVVFTCALAPLTWAQCVADPASTFEVKGDNDETVFSVTADGDGVLAGSLTVAGGVDLVAENTALRAIIVAMNATMSAMSGMINALESRLAAVENVTQSPVVQLPVLPLGSDPDPIAGAFGLYSGRRNATGPSGDVMLLMHLNVDFQDSGPNSYTFTNRGANILAIPQPSPIIGYTQAVYCDGTGSQYFDTPEVDEFDTYGAFTLEGYVRFESYDSTERYVFAHGDHPGSGIEGSFIKVIDGRIEYLYVNSAQTPITPMTTPVGLNTWYYITVVREDDGGFHLYKDGFHEDSSPPVVGPQDNAGAHTVIRFCERYGLGGRMNGWISEFRFTKAALYTQDFTPPVTPFPDGVNVNSGNGTSVSLVSPTGQVTDLHVEYAYAT